MSDTRNDFNAHWAGIRQVDVRVGAGYALLGNVLLLAVLAFVDEFESAHPASEPWCGGRRRRGRSPWPARARPRAIDFLQKGA